jgi:hypothetical protein
MRSKKNSGLHDLMARAAAEKAAVARGDIRPDETSVRCWAKAIGGMIVFRDDGKVEDSSIRPGECHVAGAPLVYE